MTLPAPHPITAEILLAQQKRGLTLSEIAAKFGMHRLVVHDRLTEYWRKKREGA